MPQSNSYQLLCFLSFSCFFSCDGGEEHPTEDESSTLKETTIEFSNLRAEEISAASAVIRFETSIETTCEVQFGTSEDRLDSLAVDPDMDPDNPYALLHRVPLEDLPENTLVYYRARATAPDGETSFSSTSSFHTLSSNGEESILEGMQNIALLSEGTRVSAVSSNFGGGKNDASWGANSAFDDQMATEWATAGDGDDAWIEVDLGAAYELAGLSFRSREMSDGTSIIKSIRVLTDDGVEAGPFLTPDPAVAYEFLLSEPINTQILRIEAESTTGGNAGAKEIGLYITK